jgi:hypothetical protein
MMIISESANMTTQKINFMSAEQLNERLQSEKIPYGHIARVCYESTKLWCELNGEKHWKNWDELNRAEKHLTFLQVFFCLDYPNTDEVQLQHYLVISAVKEGWFIGNEYDAENKRHPHLMSDWQLPEYVKTKNKLFINIVNSLK